MAKGSTTGRPLAGLAALAAGILVFPMVVQNPYYLNVVNIIGLNTIIVVGLNLLIGFAGQISLGHAAFYGLGAYISGILTVTYNVSPWVAMGLAVCATGLIALLIGIPTLKLHGHYLVMATLGFNLIANIVIIQWDAVTGGPSGFPGIPNLSVGQWTLDSDKKMYYFIWALVFFSMALALNLVNSRVGRGLRALHGSEVAAASLGVKTSRYKVKIFVLSAVYASLAGSVYAHYLTFISPKTFDIFFSVELVTMVILGGMGSIWGVLFGTVFLTSLPNVLHLFDEYKDVFYGLILVVILVLLPQGLVVAIKEKWLARRHVSPDSKPAEPKSEPRPEARGAEVLKSWDLSLPGPRVDPGGSILDVNDVAIRFGGLLALSNVSFQIPRGKVTSLIGPNGAGKTTMINVISGNYRPQAGQVFFEGNRITNQRPYRVARMGLTRTFQNLQVFSNMTVLENVMVGLHAPTKNEFLHSLFHLPGFRKEETLIEDRAWEILRFFDLEDKGLLPASGLSYGQQKRVEMARALAISPRLVLLDEPAAGLNMTESLEVANLISRMRDMGISVLLVEHDMNLVMSISDRIVVLNYGRKIADGDPQVIQRDEQVLSAYLGSVA